MDTIIESPQNEVRNMVQDINLIDVTNWNPQNQTLGNNNSTLLYIAVCINILQSENVFYLCFLFRLNM